GRELSELFAARGEVDECRDRGFDLLTLLERGARFSGLAGLHEVAALAEQHLGLGPGWPRACRRDRRRDHEDICDDHLAQGHEALPISACSASHPHRAQLPCRVWAACAWLYPQTWSPRV